MNESRRPNPLLRLLVGAFGIGWVLTAGALFAAGGVVGVVLGLAFAVVGVAIVALAAGVVEWWAARWRAGPRR